MGCLRTYNTHEGCGVPKDRHVEPANVFLRVPLGRRHPPLARHARAGRYRADVSERLRAEAAISQWGRRVSPVPSRRAVRLVRPAPADHPAAETHCKCYFLTIPKRIHPFL